MLNELNDISRFPGKAGGFLIHEVKEAGNYDLWKEELEANLERAKYFGTIGIGVKGYYESGISSVLGNSNKERDD